MGHRTILHGYIEEPWSAKCSQLNDVRIAALPEWSAETNPLVSRDMFCLPRYGYLGRILPFGRSYSGVEGHWQRWREEFEAVLRTLYWDKVHVWVETEWWGEYHCTWTKRTPEPHMEEGTVELNGDALGGEVPEELSGPTTEWGYWGPQRGVLR